MAEYEYTPLYYNGPIQVRYWTPYGYCYGIGYHDFIISLTDGQIIKIEQIIQQAPVHFDDAIIERSWVDLTPTR